MKEVLENFIVNKYQIIWKYHLNVLLLLLMKDKSKITSRTNKLLHALRGLEYKLENHTMNQIDRNRLMQTIHRKKVQLAYKRDTCPHCGKPLNI